MKKAQATGFMVLIIGLVLLVAIVFISYMSVTGLSITALMAGEVAQSTVTNLNAAMLSEDNIRIVQDCPKDYQIEIDNGRVSVRLEKFFEDKTVDAYYLTPKDAELPEDVRVVCNYSNFIIIEKWRWPSGIIHLHVEATTDISHTAMDWNKKWCCINSEMKPLTLTFEEWTNWENCIDCDTQCKVEGYAIGVITNEPDKIGDCDDWRHCRCKTEAEKERVDFKCSFNNDVKWHWVNVQTEEAKGDIEPSDDSEGDVAEPFNKDWCPEGYEFSHCENKNYDDIEHTDQCNTNDEGEHKDDPYGANYCYCTEKGT